MENTITKLESYQQQKTRHRNEISIQKGLFWAFSNDQLNEGLQKLNATVNDVVNIGAGGIILKSEIQSFKDLLKKHNQERKQLKNDTKKLYDAIVYELNNHEYCITYDTKDALDALGLNENDLPNGMLEKACKQSLAEVM